MINDETDEVIKENFDWIKNRYQNKFESIKGSVFVFNFVQLLYYKCHKIGPNHGRLYIDSPEWIKNKNSTRNCINKKDSKCFQNAVTVVLNQKNQNKKRSSKNDKN